MKKNLIIGSFLLGAFLLILLLIIFEKTGFIDNNIYNIVRLLRCDFFDNYFIFITKFGNTIFIVLVVFMFLLIFRNKYGIILGTSACISIISNSIIKKIIRRERPNGLRLIAQGGYSFPSGHAMISVCVYGYLLYLVVTKIENKVIKYIISVFLVLLILSIGISRIYVGVHYASDVIAGYLLATLEVMLLVQLTNKYYRGSRDV